MKSQYTLIAFDMDGTLLDPAKEILPQTREAVRRAAKEGKIVALCTGRALAEVRPYLDAGDLEGVRYAVLCSGSLIYDLAARRMIGHTVFTGRETAEILEALRGRNVQAQLLSGGRAVLSRRAFQHLKEYGMDQYAALYRDTAAVAEDTAEMLQRGEISCEKINLWHADCPRRNGQSRRRSSPAQGLFSPARSGPIWRSIRREPTRAPGCRRCAAFFAFRWSR